MPSVYSSEHSSGRRRRPGQADRCRLPGPADRARWCDAYQDELGLTGVAEENLQARVRGVILMALSNSEGHLVLATSNKSELAVGYSTLYGDSVGGFAPLKDVPRPWSGSWPAGATPRRAARRGRADPGELDHQAAVGRAARPGQTRPGLPPAVRRARPACSSAYVERAQGRSELIAAGFDAAVVDQVVTLVDRAEWKRRQFAPGTKISALAFGRDRRLPVTSRWREHEA